MSASLIGARVQRKEDYVITSYSIHYTKLYDWVESQHRRDRPRLEDRDLVTGDGPFDVLRAAQIPLQALGEFEQWPGKAL